MTNQSLELTRSSKLYHAINDYCTSDRIQHDKPVRRYLYINCLGYSSLRELISKTFTDHDLRTLPVQEIKQVIFGAVNIISNEVNNSDLLDNLKIVIHKNLFYLVREIIDLIWNEEGNRSRANELRKILLTTRRFYNTVNNHLDVIQKVEYKKSQNSTNCINFDDFIGKMNDLKDTHIWDGSDLMSNISLCSL